MSMQVRASRNPWSFGDLVDLRLFDPETRQYAHFVKMELVTPDPKDGPVEIPPALQVKMSDAQMLMDTLWDCGLRPTEGSGSAGALLATQKHLEDMRKLAGDLLVLVARERAK